MRAFRSFAISAFAALCAALIAHIAIDALGDVLLARDSYDALDHRSRAFVGTAVLAFVFGSGSLFVRNAFVRARGDDRAFCASLGELVPRNVVAFGVGVCALAVPLLAAMEAIDARLDGAIVSDLGDLFGGSYALGIATTLVCALACAFAVVRVLRAATVLCAALVRVVAIARRRSAARAPRVCERRFRRSAALHRSSCFGRRLVGRAPPTARSSAT